MTDSARQLALRTLRRIESDGAYANLALAAALDRSELSAPDRRFATELVYGTTRMRRACDALVDRFVSSAPDPTTRTVLRLGAYQLEFAGVAPHAAVSATVALAPRRSRGFVNAVLRRVSTTPMVWPSPWARLSYPDWIGDRLTAELGDEAGPALERMNMAPPVTVRDDGYVQDRSSQWVAAAVQAQSGELVFDACAAPGGKSTAIAAAGAHVIAADIAPGRVALLAHNAASLGGAPPAVVVTDASAPCIRPETCDAVLVDAPCSGLGALRRRADARWRITLDDVTALADLQRRLLVASAALVRPGGRLIYSVCTLTAEESIEHPTPPGFDIDPAPLPDGTWRAFGSGWRVLPHDADTDGMVVIRYRRRR